jgi:type IV pilus assembly protein PilY1
MVSQKKKWFAAASVGVLAAGGWMTYALLAAQGQGTLAQVPLNIQTSAKPAFLMALDDSGSMVWELLNNTRDGVYNWQSNSSNNTRRIGFYSNAGVPYGYGEGTQYHYHTPNYGRDGNNAIPPLDAFGFVRSPDINTAYFDPRENYPDWKTGDVNNPSYRTISPTNAPVDPRPATSFDFINLTQNLTALETRTGNTWNFRVLTGMVIPVGTVIRTGTCGANNNNSTTRDQPTGFSRITTQFTANVTGGCQTNFAYYPATFFLKEKMPADYGYLDSAITTVRNPAGGYPGTLYKYEIRLANFNNNTAKYNLAIQNFANWFSFYRTRREALIGAATNSLHEVDNLRVGWFRINGRSQATMYDLGESPQKVQLLSDIIRNMRADGSTPNRSAANYLGQQFQRTKTTRDPNPPVLLSCQKNAGMLFTDGYINESGNTTRMRRLVAPYYDNSLVPGLEGNAVPIPKECPDGKLDCQAKLHMNFYGVTLGTRGEQFGVTYVPNPLRPWELTPNPYEVPPTFGTGTVDLQPGAVDELWEAVLYSHGEMVNANRASDITSAMRRIISNVSKGQTPSGTRSLTGARIGKGSLSVEPFYEATNNGTDWYSKLNAFTLSVDPTTRAIVSEQAWEASAKMPTSTARNVWFWRNGEQLRFNATNVSLNNLCSKPTGLYSNMTRCDGINKLVEDNAEAVSYLLGSTGKEVRNGGKLRDRTTVLGDIINSTPLLSSPTDDYGYRRLGSLGTSYVEYLASKRESGRYMVYAGANDGMLHAFDGGMGSDGVQDNNGGAEVFGYVPSTAIGHMGNLLVPYDPKAEQDGAFEHRYFVDGPVVVGDTYNGSAWGTSLVGTAGAGGRSVFALDVTNPSEYGATNLLWELNDFDTQLSDVVRDNIGHVLGKPVIVPVKSSSGEISFKAIFGNGVESRNGKAALFVVDLVRNRTPTVTTYIVEEAGQNLPAGRNGLGNIVVVDRWGGTDNAQNVRGRDGFADTVYAADQKGAIWKFDLRGTDAPTKPLFTTKTHTEAGGATYRQPITGGMTAASGPAGGVMLFFGTGSFSYVEDRNDESIQGLYAFNDTSDTLPTGTVIPTYTAANLRQITVSTVNGVRRVTLADPPADSRGWTVILPAGERFVANPTLTSGIVFMPTYVPTRNAQAQGCNVDGSNWLFGLVANSGDAGLSQVRQGTPDGDSPGAGTAGVPLATGGNAPVKDVTTAVVPRLGAPEKEDGKDPPTAPGAACMMQVSVAGAPPMYLPYPCGRQSWRQIR